MCLDHSRSVGGVDIRLVGAAATAVVLMALESEGAIAKLVVVFIRLLVVLLGVPKIPRAASSNICLGHVISYRPTHTRIFPGDASNVCEQPN